MSEARVNNLSNESNTGGPTITGITTFSGTNYFVPPVGNTAQRPENPEKGSLRGKGTIQVTCLKCVRPIYPPIALRRGAEGTLKVKVWINKEGKVFKAELISISGNESIDRAAKNAAIDSTFYPLNEETSINIEYDLKIK